MVPWGKPPPPPSLGSAGEQGVEAGAPAAWEAFPAAEPLPTVGAAASSELNCSGQARIPASELAPPRQ